MTIDRMPPQATEAEGMLIASILTYPEQQHEIFATVAPVMFYRADYQAAYECCYDIYKKYGRADLTTLSVELMSRGQKDLIIPLTELFNQVISDSNIQVYGALIREKYASREFIRIANKVNEMAYSEDIKVVAEYIETETGIITGKFHSKEAKRLDSIIEPLIDTIKEIKESENKLIGIPSGFTAIDRKTGGFRKGYLTIIAGRPGMGKTAIGLQYALNTSRLGYPVALFSCEMSDIDIATRCLSNVSDYSNIELSTGRCDIDKLYSTSEQLLKLPLYIDDTAGISIQELKARTRRLILKYGIKLVIVDYLGLMSPSGNKQTREQEVSQISAGLKNTAKELDIPVIALSQLNRLSESRANHKPLLSDLRDSGSLEQDADLVLIIYRPDAFGMKTVLFEDREIDTTNIMIVDVAKNRNGATGQVILKHNQYMTVIND